ncbi:MAG: MarR family winged helix-turn-helix transcriptional regulator [Pedobacter sp.]|uniref:MarR family winged helix-turn-helix transcriptional regulator n=1 Tax=Pedobacter sp. TaxID=1411316 RepID=UPI0035689698
MAKSTINNIRAFNRYYTNVIGLLDKGYLETKYSLTEARILFEIYSAGKIDTSEIIDATLIDKSYLSRILKKLEKDKLITRSKSAKDSRVSQVTLTEKGLIELNYLNELTDRLIEKLLEDLTLKDQKNLVLHMNSIIQILNNKSLNIT